MSETALALRHEPLPVYGHFEELRRAVLNGVAAENSRRNYGLALDELSAFCRQRKEPISRTLLLQFRSAMLDRNLSPSTINVKLSAIRSLIGEARRAGVLGAEDASQMTDIPNVRQQGIENDQVRQGRAGPFQRQQAVGSRNNLITSRLKTGNHQSEHIGFVLRHQYLKLHAP